MVYSLSAVGLLDWTNSNSSETDVTSPAHYALARKLAAESAVLLQNNNGLLPLDAAALIAKGAGAIAVIGLAGRDAAIYGGGGSGAVTPKAPVTVFDGVLGRLGVPVPPGPPKARCAVVDPNTDYFGGQGKSRPAALGPNATAADCCRACAAGPGTPTFTFAAAGAIAPGSRNCWCHQQVNKKTAKPGYSSGTCSAQPGPTSVGPVTYLDGRDAAAAQAAAAKADVAIVVIAQTSHEDADRVRQPRHHRHFASAPPPYACGPYDAQHTPCAAPVFVRC